MINSNLTHERFYVENHMVKIIERCLSYHNQTDINHSKYHIGIVAT